MVNLFRAGLVGNACGLRQLDGDAFAKAYTTPVPGGQTGQGGVGVYHREARMTIDRGRKSEAAKSFVVLDVVVWT